MVENEATRSCSWDHSVLIGGNENLSFFVLLKISLARNVYRKISTQKSASHSFKVDLARFEQELNLTCERATLEIEKSAVEIKL